MRVCIAALSVITGCVEFNADCPPNDTSVIGRTDTLLDLRRETVRAGEAAVGNLIADAFYAHYSDLFGSSDQVIAVVNAGSIRDRNSCRVTELIDRGPITLGQVADMLPFDNDVVLTEVTERELWRIFEHSVARLGDPGESGLARQFLHVSHIELEVDCDLLASVDDQQVGRRVTAIRVRDKDGNLETLDRDNPSDTEPTIVITNSWLAEGGDGYVDVFEPATGANDSERADFLVVGDYILNNTPVAPMVEGRIRIEPSCASGQ